MMKKILKKIYFGTKYYYFKYLTKNIFKTNVNKWFLQNGDENLLIKHKLNNNSIVFEVGGYKGIWTDKIIQKYNCNIYIFEPVKEFYTILINKYLNNNKIKIFNFGLSNKDEKIKIYLSEDGSSLYKNKKNTETIILKDILGFLNKNKLNNINIDLISINIEGGEYILLDRILKNTNIFKSIQVQFHDFVDLAEEKRYNILKLLKKKKYKIKYSFPFVWELFTK